MALGVVGVEQVVGRVTAYRRSELPAQVHRVLYADAQALAARGQVDVGGVAGEQDPVPAVRADQVRRVGEGADPQGVVPVDVLAGQALPRGGHLGEPWRYAVARRYGAALADDDAVDVVAQRRGHDHAPLDPFAQRPRAQPGTLDVGQEHLHACGGTGEVEPGRPPDRAATAVAADQVPAAQVDLHAVAEVGQPDESTPAPQVHAEFAGPVLENPLGRRLEDPAYPEIGARQGGEINDQATEMTDRAVLRLAEPGHQPALVETLRRPGGEPQAARLPVRLVETVDHHHARPAEQQFTGEHESGRSRPHNHDVGIHEPSSLRTNNRGNREPDDGEMLPESRCSARMGWQPVRQ